MKSTLEKGKTVILTLNNNECDRAISGDSTNVNIIAANSLYFFVQNTEAVQITVKIVSFRYGNYQRINDLTLFSYKSLFPQVTARIFGNFFKIQLARLRLFSIRYSGLQDEPEKPHEAQMVTNLILNRVIAGIMSQIRYQNLKHYNHIKNLMSHMELSLFFTESEHWIARVLKWFQSQKSILEKMSPIFHLFAIPDYQSYHK